jgi:hypothetical protein
VLQRYVGVLWLVAGALFMLSGLTSQPRRSVNIALAVVFWIFGSVALRRRR